MRLALACLVLAACSERPEPPDDPLPDAGIVNDCEGTTFDFVAPVEGEHYDPANLVAQIELSTFYVQIGYGISIYDDAGNVLQPSAGPTVADLDDGADTATWSFANLTPATRYTWDAWTLDCDRTETFFTN
jgi:hypothetical protein